MRPRDRPKVVAAGLIACVIAIAWGVWRHRDAPSVDVGFMFPETREHALKRMAAESARQEAWLVRTKAWIKKDHETALGDLIKARPPCGHLATVGKAIQLAVASASCSRSESNQRYRLERAEPRRERSRSCGAADRRRPFRSLRYCSTSCRVSFQRMAPRTISGFFGCRNAPSACAGSAPPYNTRRSSEAGGNQNWSGSNTELRGQVSAYLCIRPIVKGRS